jgi:hypothetical protein
MHKYSLALLLLFGGCQTHRPVTWAETTASEAEPITFSILGVKNPGPQKAPSPITLFQAIELTGGLNNCDECLKAGGVKQLWKTVGPAYIRRGESSLQINRKDFRTFVIEEGDEIYISHLLL